MVDQEAILDRNIIREPPKEFQATFLEWVSDNNAETKLLSGFFNASSNQIIYTVPENFNFFITSASLTLSCIGGAPSERIVHLTVDDSLVPTLLACAISASSSNTAQISFPMPIRLNDKQFLRILNPANTLSTYNITGFLLPKKISIR